MDLFGLISSFGNIIYVLIAFVVALSVIVAVHEYGHYIVGKWSGIYAEVFSIGFGPVLFAREDKYGTKWQIAAVPLGGYVKFLGDASAVSDKASDDLATMDAETLRHTMHGAPLWARAATVVAGPVFNFILALVIFMAMAMIWGKPIEPPTISEVKNIPAYGNALQAGDVVLSIEGAAVDDFESYYEAVGNLPSETPLTYTVRRDGQVINLAGPHPFPPMVGTINAKSAAVSAGLKPGDVITSINGTPITAFTDLQDFVFSSEGAALDLKIWRDGEVIETTLNPKVTDTPTEDGGFEKKYMIGISGDRALEWQTEFYGPLEAAQLSFKTFAFTIERTVSGLYHLVAGRISTCNIGGPITIARTSGVAASQGVATFVNFLAALSIAVGILNLLPIPVLDGGHLVFHAYEAVSGKPPSDGVLRALMGFGFVLLMSLMAFALTHDIFCP